ncbi:hypothetical protein [Nitriliruptor alkaliphilus]|uniref:hypothetical protein n=1 Tax=Nitriliruptor alkaliphilus TaxID=427918 RepID=UPI0012ECE05E|nr:hypothetical protein [Nitriliruptor alkaliphilus]
MQRRVEVGEVAVTPSEVADAELTDGQVEQVFHELYPRVRDELRWELRVQRERAGLLSDPL